MIAALLRRPSRCRSRQLLATWVCAPTNHFAYGGFQSSTFFQGLNQWTYCLAICAQKRSGLFAPSLRNAATSFLLQCARFANSLPGSKTRFSLSRDSMSGTGAASSDSVMARSPPSGHPGFDVVDALRNGRGQVLVTVVGDDDVVLDAHADPAQRGRRLLL